MKRFLYLLMILLTFGLSWTGCSSDDETNPSAIISLSKNEIQFDSNSGSQTIVVTSSDKWTMTGDEGSPAKVGGLV